MSADQLTALRDRTATLENESAKHTKELKLLGPFKDEIIRLMMGVLEAWANDYTNKEYLSRHEVAHGGHVLAGCEAIGRMGLNDASKAMKWSSTFTQQYGISYTLLKDEILMAPTQVIDIFNISVNVSNLHTWAKPEKKAVAKNILDLCKETIQQWQDWLVGGKRNTYLFAEGMKAEDLYNQIRTLYDTKRYA